LMSLTYNDLELLLFNYMLLIMVVVKQWETSMPKQQLGWAGCLSLFHGCHEPSFDDLCSKFKVIWKDKISEANFCCTYYINYFLFSTCTLCYIIHVLILALPFFCGW
jgi:hypothetical protein